MRPSIPIRLTVRATSLGHGERQSGAHRALGYQSWDDYCTREFGTSRIRLPREERQEVVASLRESGLSIRAIEAVTGVSRPTVIKDLREGEVVKSSPPAPVEMEFVDEAPAPRRPDHTDDAGCTAPRSPDYRSSDK